MITHSFQISTVCCRLFPLTVNGKKDIINLLQVMPDWDSGKSDAVFGKSDDEQQHAKYFSDENKPFDSRKAKMVYRRQFGCCNDTTCACACGKQYFNPRP